ncbi:endonuclease/exonuclease/phosphatase family protein [Nocardioides sp. P86]|uniref:endonuclease/exonuclease/phosphatase family protein n=1 Tax=Nocardioides sp. P86 TaxID=2939569 RepID=UPI00203BAD8F|nr:endonuclease/exonuclease/phosphatase family protein [Nocardioides sp. P86]MCM3515476.1 endonuclease/exonuclease/phosphatase family protein [Nocardioides sp. P86]
MTEHVVKAQMARRRHWAGIWSRHPLTPLPDQHGASAMAEILGRRFCSSILPWRSCGSREPWAVGRGPWAVGRGPWAVGRGPWAGANTTERTIDTVGAIRQAAPDIWGGDWNHALHGREFAGSKAGRDHLLTALAELGLHAATTDAPHQIEGLRSIDHIAIPATWSTRVEHHSALLDEGRLSDHDAYVVEVIEA